MRSEEYIAVQISSGTPEENIRAFLREGGWNDADIQHAFDAYRSLAERRATYQASASSRILRYISYVFYVILALGFIGMLVLLLYLARHAGQDFKDNSSPQVLGDYESVVALPVQVGLERYKQEHGSYPISLDQLMPQYLQSIPTDPISKESFSYTLSTSTEEYELCTHPEANESFCGNSHATLNGKDISQYPSNP